MSREEGLHWRVQRHFIKLHFPRLEQVQGRRAAPASSQCLETHTERCTCTEYMYTRAVAFKKFTGRGGCQQSRVRVYIHFP